MKRFYQQAATARAGDGWAIELDGRAVRTPGGRALAAPTALLAEAIAEEWNAQGETIDPRAMRLTGLANAAVERIAPDPAAFARGLAAYGESDLLCYRADGPAPLVARQAGTWDPLLAWARARYEIVFEIVTGIIHKKQPPETVERLAAALAAHGPFALAGLSPLVTISGSLIVALALAEGAIGLDAAWAAAALDETWQAEKWGEDAEAVKALAARHADFAAATRFLSLL
jgi:chaperone required for assembly of F1-ATPase